VNRLADATSPYLLQHADNPVDWWPWGDDAFAEARHRDVPVLLSVGYAACHWCHVMAHESFEDNATAAYLNEHFVNIKVDREERPDVDAIYMAATQAMTGQGGWPMTCVLTPDGQPFFCGTYFPDLPRQGMPSFRQVLAAVMAAWHDRRSEVDRVGADVVARLRESSRPPPHSALDETVLDAAVQTLVGQFDSRAGGFGGAPKFPPSMLMEFLLRHHARTGGKTSLSMVELTCERMARGGLYDQLAGGFARYSVDARWVVPHFEKMLYDNALLMRAYLHWWRFSDNDLARRVVSQTGDFLLAELATAEGGLASALDADSAGEEGTYYVWTPNQLAEILGPDDGAWAAQLLGVTATGTFEHGASTLQLLRAPDDARWALIRARLHAVRAQRVRPGRDDKVVAAWNGLAIVALAESGVLLERADLVAAAVSAGDLLASVHVDEEGRLWRTSRDGRRGENAGLLEDYGCVAAGFLALLGATGESRWLERAGELLDRALEVFADGEGGWYDTAVDAPELVVRPRDVTDNVTPSGTAALAEALLAYAAVTGSGRHRDAAEAAVASAGGVVRQAPRFGGWSLALGEALVAGPVAVAVVGPAAERGDLHRAALRMSSPGAVVIAGDPDDKLVPLLADRTLVDGQPAAYVCRGFVCDRPTTDPADLSAHP